MRRMRTIGDQDGFAMVIALLVAMVVLSLSMVVVSMSIHNLDQSHYDRRRLIAVAAAEAGVNRFHLQLASTRPSDPTFKCYLTGTVTSGPSTGRWTGTMLIYSSNAAGATPISNATPTAGSDGCSLPATLPSTLYAKITSIGAAPSTSLLRKMESYVRLNPNYGGSGAAVLSTSSTSIANKLSVAGADGNDGDIYVSCPTTPCDLTMSNNQVVSGNIYVMGSVVIRNSVAIAGDLWAKGDITMSGSSLVQGSVISSTGAISVLEEAVIRGDATMAAATSSLTSYSARVNGLVLTGVASPDPKNYALPQITLNATEQAAWNTARYEIKSFTGASACTNAKAFITGSVSPNTASTNTYGTKDWVVWVNNAASPCTLGFSNNETINVPGNLAIIVDKGAPIVGATAPNPGGNSGGAIRTDGLVNFQAKSDATLFLIVRHQSQACSSSSGAHDIVISNNTNFLNVAESPNLGVYFYSPCSVSLSNQNLFNGQIAAMTVNIANQVTMNYRPVIIPGASVLTGYKQDIQYLREVA